MESCLLCLELNKDLFDCIKVNSKQWQEDNIKLLIEKHFWSMETIKSNSWLCSICWRELYDFHNFYLRIAEAHADFGRLTKTEDVVQEGTKPDQEDYKDTLEKDDSTKCYIEPEILIYQPSQENLTLEDQNSIIKEELDDLAIDDTTPQLRSKRKRFSKILSHDTELTIEDPLEKCETSKRKVIKSTKSKNKKTVKYSKNSCSTIEANLQTDQSNEQLEIKQDPDSLDIDKMANSTIDSYKSDDSDHKSDTESNYDPDSDTPPETIEDESKSVKKTYNPNRIQRKGNDKFIAENFKGMLCDLCQLPMETFRLIVKHFADEHNQKGYVICCTRKFFKRNLLVDHIHWHLNPNQFKCNQCDKSFGDHLRLERHVKTVHREGERVKKHCCDVCGKSFAESSKLKRHKLTHMSEEEKMFRCKECGKTYASAYNLTFHIQAAHLKKWVKMCHICGKTIGTSTEYRAHMDKHEGKPPPDLRCDICGLRLTCERGLKLHKEDQHPEGGKKDHYCPICQKISPTLRALKKHINTMHEKGHDHKCTICEKSFKRKETLNEHMASHTGTALYTCPWCPKTFNSNGNMHAHRKKIHPKEWEEAKLQKYSGILPQEFKISELAK